MKKSAMNNSKKVSLPNLPKELHAVSWGVPPGEFQFDGNLSQIIKNTSDKPIHGLCVEPADGYEFRSGVYIEGNRYVCAKISRKYLLMRVPFTEHLHELMQNHGKLYMYVDDEPAAGPFDRSCVQGIEDEDTSEVFTACPCWSTGEFKQQKSCPFHPWSL